jgi:hypothetical protein
MKFYCRQHLCNFREFLSAYLASTPGYATTEQALGLAHALLTQHLLKQTLSEEQRVQISRDTGGQCMVECESVEEFMNIPVSAITFGERGSASSKPGDGEAHLAPIKLPIRAEYGNRHSKGGVAILVGADNETVGELWSASEQEVNFLVERVNRETS